MTGNLFPSLGVTPQFGRLLTPADDASDQNKVAVLSDEIWRERFGADPAIVGHTIQLDGDKVTVVGHRAARISRFRAAARCCARRSGRRSGLRRQQLSQRRSNYLMAIGRLAPGATVADRAGGTQQDLRRDRGDLSASCVAKACASCRSQSESVAAVKTPLLLMFGAVCMVLLIAATNVASLLLARGVHRRRETAIRSALGGSRWAVMRPVLLESMLLAMAGVILGLALAWVGRSHDRGARRANACRNSPGFSVDLRVIVFALVLALIVAIACGAVPAWRARRLIRRTRCATVAAAAWGAAGIAPSAHWWWLKSRCR